MSRYFSTSVSCLLKKNRPETIYTFSTTYPRNQQQSVRGRGNFKRGRNTPSRLNLASTHNLTNSKTDNIQQRGEFRNQRRGFNRERGGLTRSSQRTSTYTPSTQQRTNSNIHHTTPSRGNDSKFSETRSRSGSIRQSGSSYNRQIDHSSSAAKNKNDDSRVDMEVKNDRLSRGRSTASRNSSSRTNSKAHSKSNSSSNKEIKSPSKFELEGARFIQYMAAQTQTDAPEILSFHKLGLKKEVIDAIKNHGFERPTKIQSLGIKPLMDTSKDVYIGSETGSGKTMTYLAAIFNNLVVEDQLDKKMNPETPLAFRKLKRPRAVVLVPSRHLVEQVTHVAKQMSHFARLRVVGIHSNMMRSEIEDILKSPVDILVCTPGAYTWLSNGSQKHIPGKVSKSTNQDIKRGFELSLSKCKHLVIDECDTLFDAKQVHECEHIFNPLLKRKKEHAKNPDVLNCQFALVSATLPVTLLKYIDRTFPSLLKITTNELHKPPPTLKQEFIRIHASTTKENILIDVLKRGIMNGDKRFIVFTNRLDHVSKLSFKLAESGFNVFGLSSQTNRQLTAPKLKSFLDFPQHDTPKEMTVFVRGEMEDVSEIPFSLDKSAASICVTTDMFSRGVDTMSCGHVVMFDFPTTTIDYLHRAGRTARNGTFGQVTSIVGSKDRQLATAIEYSYRKKLALTSGNR